MRPSQYYTGNKAKITSTRGGSHIKLNPYFKDLCTRSKDYTTRQFSPLLEMQHQHLNTVHAVGQMFSQNVFTLPFSTNQESDETTGNINHNTERRAHMSMSTNLVSSRIYLLADIQSQKALLLHGHVQQTGEKKELPEYRLGRSSLASGAGRKKTTAIIFN